jgi:plasmid stabilization system protein ParE
LKRTNISGIKVVNLIANYKLSDLAKEDLIKIHKYGVEKFGMTPADKYFDSFFESCDIIAENPFYFESIDYITKWIYTLCFRI